MLFLIFFYKIYIFSHWDEDSLNVAKFAVLHCVRGYSLQLGVYVSALHSLTVSVPANMHTQ